MNQPAISVNELRCSYGDFEAVQGVDFEVAPGELFALLGTNGAGKTTIMETVEGHRPATSGSVRVLGCDPWRERAKVRPRVGIMLQEGGFAGDLTVSEMVRLWCSMISHRADVDTTLEMLSLQHRRNVRIKQLSGGERRRLDLVLAVLGRPELLFLDEPTTGLDPESRKSTWEVVRSLLAEGTTVLMTTHYLEEAERLAHRLAIMHAGRIQVSGSLVDVLSTQHARIRFDLVDQVTLPELIGTAEINEQGRVEIRTQELQRDLHVLLNWANAHHVTLNGLRAQNATLDDVFHSVRTSQHGEVFDDLMEVAHR